MSKSSRKIVEDSENILQESTIDAKGPVQVGNNSIHNNITINFKIEKVFLVLLPLIIISIFSWYFFKDSVKFDSKLDIDKSSSNEVSVLTENDIGAPASNKLIPDTNQSNSKKYGKPRKQVFKVQNASTQIRTVGIDFSKVDPRYRNILFDAYNKAFEQIELNLVDVRDHLPYELKFSIELKFTINPVENRGQKFEVETYLSSILYDIQREVVIDVGSKLYQFTLRDSTKIGKVLFQKLQDPKLLHSIVSKQQLTNIIYKNKSS